MAVGDSVKYRRGSVSSIRTKPRLPHKQLFILCLCRLSEPICLTSIFSYLPQMIRSFGVADADVGYWAGLTAASFSIAQCLTGILWGRLSDSIGRKPTIIAGFLGMLISIILFGFSTSIPMAMVSRCAIGLLNGNVGILRTIVAELVPEKELQPKAFSLLPLTWSIGSIMGPVVGGFLSEPGRKYPGIVGKGSFFDRHPWAAPNIFAAIVLLNAMLLGALFLDETLVTKRGDRDRAREVGKKIERLLSRGKRRIMRVGSGSIKSRMEFEDEEQQPMLRDNEVPVSPITGRRRRISKTSDHKADNGHIHDESPVSWNQILTRQSVFNIIIYFMISIHVVSYEQVLPVFLSTETPEQSGKEIHLPFQIPGGFALSTSQIGMIYSFNGITAMLLQFFVYPPLAAALGPIKCLAVSATIYPPLYIATVYTLVLRNHHFALGVAWVVLIIFKSIVGVFAFTSSTILITNTASSIRVLGTLNGIATSVAAFGRAVGPSFFGLLFTVGQRTGYGWIPWMGFAIVAAGMWVFIVRLEEGHGLKEEVEEIVEEENQLELEEEEEDVKIISYRDRGHVDGRLGISSGVDDE